MKTTQSRSISELYDRCTYEDWKEISKNADYFSLIKTGLELYIKSNLDLQRKNMFNYACKIASKCDTDERQFEEIRKIFIMNNIDSTKFANDLRTILNKTEIKINSLRLYGCSNSCKTLIANCICSPFITCYMNNHGSENEFFMSNMLNKSIILCEELYITVATAEDFKSVLGGQPLDIAKKFNEKQCLSRTPCIITSNWTKFGRGHLPAIDENALCLRCKNYMFTSKVTPALKIEWQQFYLFMLSVIM